MSNLEKTEDEGPAISDILSTFTGNLKTSAEALTPEILQMSDEELEKHFTRTEKDFIIRKNIHRLAKEALLSGKKIKQLDVYSGVCSRQNFTASMARNPYRIAWYLRPFDKYEDLIEESFYFGLQRARRELLTMPINEKTAATFVKVLEFFANRHLGPLLQKVESKTLSATVDLNKPQLSPDEIRKRIEEMERDKPMLRDVSPG